MILNNSKIWGLGIGDWGLGIGDWAIPNPQSPYLLIYLFSYFHFNYNF